MEPVVIILLSMIAGVGAIAIMEAVTGRPTCQPAAYLKTSSRILLAICGMIIVTAVADQFIRAAKEVRDAEIEITVDQEGRPDSRSSGD